MTGANRRVRSLRAREHRMMRVRKTRSSIVNEQYCVCVCVCTYAGVSRAPVCLSPGRANCRRRDPISGAHVSAALFVGERIFCISCVCVRARA